MVCAKCAKLSKGTTLATPAVKRKSDMYHGSAAGSASASSSRAAAAAATKSSSTLGQAGIGKSKLLSKSAKNPYAQYSSSCQKCKTKISQGHSYCQKCAYQADVCAVCGKPNTKSKSSAPVISGQKFSLK